MSRDILDLHILVIMVLRGTEKQKREAFEILGPKNYEAILLTGKINHGL